MARPGLLARLFGWLLPANDDARAPAPAEAVDIQEDPASQLAALPWRRRKGVVEVLLVTSRETRRWVAPKGWPMKNKRPHEAAAQEAFEEAGVRGKVAEASLGAYHYDKALKSGALRHCAVDVFPLKVDKTLDSWPEKGQRDRTWFPAETAAGLVAEPELAEIIRIFGAANAKPPPKPRAKKKAAKTQTATPKGGRAVRRKPKAQKAAPQ